MNKKVTILLIFLMLANAQYSMAGDTINNNKEQGLTKVETQKVEAKKAVPKVKSNEFKNFLNIFKKKNKASKKGVKQEVEGQPTAAVTGAKTDVKNALIWDKKDNIAGKTAQTVTGKNPNAPQKLEKVKEAKKQDKGSVVITPESGSVNAQLVQGSVATDKIISIDDCVKLALANHPAIKSSMSSADIYKNKIAQAWAAYFPTLGADFSYSRNDMLVTNMSLPNQKYNLYNAPRITGQMLLFDFGKTKATADISTRTYEAAKSNVQTSINQVVYDVKEAYYNLLFAIQQEQVYEDTVKDYELHLKQAEAYYKIGTKAKIDVMTAEYNLGKARLNLIKAKNTVAMAYAQVNNAMGLPEYNSYNITESLESKSYKINFDEIIKTAYETRPELLSAKKKAEASEILIKASVRAFAPNITAFGNYTAGGKTPRDDSGYQLGAGLSYQSTNLYLLKKQVDEAKMTHKRDLSDFENTKQRVYLEVKQANIQLLNAQQSIPVAKLSLKKAKEQYDLASGRYKVGMGDAIELKDAENTYRNAQLDYYNILLNYSISAANIERVVGAPIKPSDEPLL